MVKASIFAARIEITGKVLRKVRREKVGRKIIIYQDKFGGLKKASTFALPIKKREVLRKVKGVRF